jgi:hypothetical protein
MKAKLEKHFSEKQLFLFPLNFFNAQRRPRYIEPKENGVVREKCACTAYNDNNYSTENFYKAISKFNL